MSRLQPEQLKDELRIVWLEDIQPLDYVREEIFALPFRGTRPRWASGRLVGYAVLAPTARPETPGMFPRRVFWLDAHDRANMPNGVYKSGAPIEAVDPSTIVPGVPGVLTERAWGMPVAGGAQCRHWRLPYD